MTTTDFDQLVREASHARVYAVRSFDGIVIEQRPPDPMHPDRVIGYLKAAQLEPGSLLEFRAKYLDAEGFTIGEAILYEA